MRTEQNYHSYWHDQQVFSAGMPEALLAAGGASVVLCTLGMSFFGALAFPHSPQGLVWLHLPLSVLSGCAAGAAAAAVCTLRALWSTPHQQAAIMLLLGQALAFLGQVCRIASLSSSSRGSTCLQPS